MKTRQCQPKYRLATILELLDEVMQSRREQGPDYEFAVIGKPWDLSLAALDTKPRTNAIHTPKPSLFAQRVGVAMSLAAVATDDCL